MIKLFKLFKIKRGASLVEVVASLALLSLIAVFIITVLVSSLNVINNNVSLSKKDEDAAAGIENSFADFDADSSISIVSEQSNNIQVTFGGNTINITGKYLTGSDKGSNSKYYYFSPD